MMKRAWLFQLEAIKAPGPVHLVTEHFLVHAMRAGDQPGLRARASPTMKESKPCTRG
ncbi:hypothetical protein GF325_17300 [Candidatus Bathyarchaeota archaeon]|nr:hypothetical protein [Candidatus Bathyarchaeota archaeon]